MKIADLVSYGYPQNLINIWEQEGSSDLLPLQVRAIQEHHILDVNSKNLLIIAPTSSGKSFIGELVAVKEAVKMNRSLFLVPYRAIAEELYESFTKKYKEYGIKIAVSDRDHSEYDEDIISGEYSVAIIVYEKLSNLLITKPDIFSGCSLVIADEVQMMMDENRGPTIELLLTKILLSANPIRIIALSAVLDKLNDFDKWLQAEVIADQHRPIELREGIYTRDGQSRYREFNTKQTGIENLAPWSTTSEGFLTLCQAIIDRNEQVLVFCRTRQLTVDVASFLAKNLSGASPAVGVIQSANSLADSSTREELQSLLQAAVAYHNSDLMLEERRIVEEGFRNKEIKILTCTSTLAMGINVPARNTIIDPYKWSGSQFVPINVAEYKNMAGRAGRYSAGDAYGCSYLIADSPASADACRTKYILGTVEGFASCFGDQRIDSQVLEIIAGGLASTPEEVSRFIFSTYNGKHHWTTDQRREAVQQMVSEAIERGQVYKAIEIDKSGMLVATNAGRLCAAGGYSLDHLELSMQYIKENNNDTAPSVIFWALETDKKCGQQAYHIPRLRGPEFSDRKYQNALVELAGNETLGHVLDTLAQEPHTITYDQCVILRRCLACYAWISSIPIKHIRDNFPRVTPGAIKNTAEVCAWLISLLGELAKTLESQSDRYNDLRQLVGRLSYGATKDSLELCHIRDSGLSREERNHLVEKGIRTLDDILAHTFQQIPLQRGKAIRLISAAEATIENNVERRRRSQCSRLNSLGIDISIVTKIYEKEGRDLEFAVDDMLSKPFINLTCQRVTRQREGDPDHLIYDSNRNIFAVQTTASEKRNITMSKAVAVIGQSAKYNPVGYIVIGRPDFETLAIKNAEEQVASGKNYKLCSVCVLAEMYVLFREDKLTSDEIEKILLEWKGYITIEEIYKFLGTKNTKEILSHAPEPNF